MNPATKKILIADDDSSIRLVLSQAFTRLGYQVRATGNASTLLKWVQEGEGDLILTDVMMPDENVFNVLPKIRKERPKLPIIVMSAQNTLLTAVNAADAGAFEYLSKPFDLDDVTAAARRALSRPTDTEAAKAQARAMKDERLPLIGRSAPMQEVYRTVARLVGADLKVLILGESGTGKELVARALHDLGRRRDGKFVVINLAAVPRERVETELFGREDGDHGKLVEADGGTLFLDEIGDMPLSMQAKLLRVLETGEVVRLGSNEPRKVDVRLVSATNKDLKKMIEEKSFRNDLYFRIKGAEVRLPPLRERREDIPRIVRHAIVRAAESMAKANGKTLASTAIPDITDSALMRLTSYSWPGNVRHLLNVVENMVVVAMGEASPGQIVKLDLRHIPDEVRINDDEPSESVGMGSNGSLAGTTLEQIEKRAIRETLRLTGGNREQAAQMLGLGERTLYRKLKDYGLR